MNSTHRWARDYDKCIQCGSTEWKHEGKGLCSHCRGKSRYKPVTVKKKTGRKPRDRAAEYRQNISKEADKLQDKKQKSASSSEPDKAQGSTPEFYELVARWMNVEGVRRRVRAKVLGLCPVKDAIGAVFYAVSLLHEPSKVEYWPTGECQMIGYWR